VSIVAKVKFDRSGVNDRRVDGLLIAGQRVDKNEGRFLDFASSETAPKLEWLWLCSFTHIVHCTVESHMKTLRQTIPVRTYCRNNKSISPAGFNGKGERRNRSLLLLLLPGSQVNASTFKMIIFTLFSTTYEQLLILRDSLILGLTDASSGRSSSNGEHGQDESHDQRRDGHDHRVQMVAIISGPRTATRW
jgi:hypothetical protein